MSAIGTAVVGLGYWGPNLARNLNACGDTELRYLCDRNLRAAEDVQVYYPHALATNSFDRVLTDPAVDAVVIATPLESHYMLAMHALQAGKHVLLEKPLALSTVEGEALVEVAKKRGLQLMCDHTHCYAGTVTKMREIVSSGQLGQMLYFDSVRVNLGLFQSGVSVLWDLAPIDLSIMDFVLPQRLRPIAVSAHGVDAMKTGFESIVYLTLFFEDGLLCHVHTNWLSPIKVRNVLIGGTKKMISWDDNNPAEKLKIFDKGVEVANSDRNRLLVNYRHGAGVIPVLDNSEPLALVVREFARAIEEQDEALTSAASGLRILNVLEAANTSLRNGGARIELAQ